MFTHVASESKQPRPQDMHSKLPATFVLLAALSIIVHTQLSPFNSLSIVDLTHMRKDTTLFTILQVLMFVCRSNSRDKTRI